MSANKQILHVGDTILWFPFGSLEPNEAMVCGIEVGCEGEKTGTEVNEVSWDEVHIPGNCIVDLTNGQWAYGYQIKPVDPLDTLGSELREKIVKRLKEGGAQ